jgi:DNA-binding MarR family transcriptional regulator
MARSQGAELALLLLGGFDAMVEQVVAGLADRGHPGVRPVHEFALRGIDDGAGTASELGRAMGVSKQAAAKTIAALEQMGYVQRGSDPFDGRRQLVRVTDRGHEMVAIGGALFDQVRAQWAHQVGERALTKLEKNLGQLIRPRTVVTEDVSSA